MAESLVRQSIKDENTLSEMSNPTSYGGLAINASHLVEESGKLYLRGNITINDLKMKLIAQDRKLQIKQGLTIYRKAKEIKGLNG